MTQRKKTNWSEMSCHGEEKCVSYKNNNTVKEVVKHEFLHPLQCHVPSHKYEHIDAYLCPSTQFKVFSGGYKNARRCDAWVGAGADFALCLCLRCLGSMCLSFIRVGHVGCVQMRLITASAASFTSSLMTRA